MLHWKLTTLVLATAMLPAVACQTSAAQKPKPTRKIVYKTVGKVSLQLHLYEPKDHKPKDKRPAVVFFFGGGWNGGAPTQFYTHCAHLAERGMVAAAAEYRVKKKHGTSPDKCVSDGKSAVRYLRANAKKLGIDPDRIVAGGGSAGGHVAAATATVTAFDEPGEDSGVSAVPNALVLFNPVYDNSKNGYGYGRVKEHWKEISPLHNIRKGMPPAIVFLGTKDKLIPVKTAENFRDRMKAVGSRSELVLFEGQPHGFFNYGRNGNKYYLKTVKAMDEFLASLGYVE